MLFVARHINTLLYKTAVVRHKTLSCLEANTYAAKLYI